MNGEKLIAMLQGEPFDLQQTMLDDYADYVEIDEQFLYDLIFEIRDAKLFRYIMEQYCSDVDVSEDFLREVNDSFHNPALLKHALQKLYDGRQVSEAFLSDLAIDYRDESCCGMSWIITLPADTSRPGFSTRSS